MNSILRIATFWVSWLMLAQGTAQAQIAVNKSAPIIPKSFGSTPIKALEATAATGGSGAFLRFRILSLPTKGVLQLNNNPVAVNTVVSLANKGNLTYNPSNTDPAGNYSFTYRAEFANGNTGAATFSLPVSNANCSQNSAIDFSERTVGENWKAQPGVTVGNTMVSTQNYISSVPTGQTNILEIDDQPGTISTQGLLWQLNNQNVAGNNESRIEMNFSRPVRNLAFSMEDIDISSVAAGNGSDFVDEVTFNAYALGSSTPYQLVAADVALGSNNTNTFVAGTNTVKGTAINNGPLGTVVLTYPSGVAISRLEIIYRNTQTYTAGNGRTQTVGIPSMVWCAEVDLLTTLVGPGRAQAGQPVTYTAVTKNQGDITAAGVQANVQLTAGLANVTINGVAAGTSYNSVSGLLTLPAIGNLAPNASSTSAIGFTMPATGSATGQAQSTTTGLDVEPANNNGSLAAAKVTTLQNQLPTAISATNAVLANTAGSTALSPSPSLAGTDPDGNVVSFNIKSLPTSGTLTFNNVTVVVGASIPANQLNQLRFTPASGQLGTASFTFTAVDDNNGESAAAATYSIPVQNPAPNNCAVSYFDGVNAYSGLSADYVAGTFATILNDASGDDLNYFATRAGTGNSIKRIDAQLNFTSNGSAAWGNIMPPASGSAADYDLYSSRYRGSIFLAKAGAYTFYTSSDDASYLWIDGAALPANNTPTMASALVNNGGRHGNKEISSATVRLSAGFHNVLLFFSEDGGGNVFTFSYKGSAEDGTTIAKVIVPNAILCAGKSNLPPVATNVTNAPGIPNTFGATAIAPLAGTDADGTVDNYIIATLPLPAQGVLSLNGAAVVAGQQITAAQAAQLKFAPTAGFTGNATFTFHAVDNTPQRSNDPATYTIPVAATYALSGTIFEDVNYGGGTGRNFGTANTSAVASGFATNAIGRNGATVELYDNATGLLASNVSANSTTTGTNGAYSFGSVPTGSYTVRVVNSTVTSTRPGSVVGLLPVQTFRTVNGTDDGNRVGGENPAGAEGGPGTANISFTGLNASGDNTIFIDNIEVLQSGTALAVNPLRNAGFETGTLTANNGTYEYTPPSNSWIYSGVAGIQTNNSAFTPPNTTNGSRAGFIQGANSTISQGIDLPAGTYTLRFEAANRTYQGQQTMNVTVNGITVLANLQATPGAYATYQTAAFTIGQQSASPVMVGTTATTGVDFGFNFSTITNTNNTGQGSLRQFITNSNALTNANLNQTAFNNNGTALGNDPAAGVEASIFMIGDGRASGVPAGLRSGVNGGFVGNTATINLASALPSITDSFTALDGSTQTTATGDNVPAVAETTTGPEVIIDYKAFAGLVVTGGNARIASLGLNNANGGANQGGAGVTLLNAGASNSTVTDVTTSSNNRTGVRVEGGVASVTVSNNVLNSNSGNGTLDADGLELLGSTFATVRGNTISNNKGYGIFMTTTTNSGATISNNVIRNNGSGTSAADAGISVGLQSDNNLFLSNTITGNAGDGIVALAGAQGNRFSQNNISSNGGANAQNLGIDLTASTTASTTVTGDGVSLNADGKTTTSGANSLLNFPVFTQATINAGRLYVSGYVKAGATVEIFVASADPSGFGEGATYSFTATEGSSDDSDPRFASYNGTVGIPAGSPNQGSETGVSRFIFSFPVDAAQIAAFTNNKLTATASVPALVNGIAVGNTSEFSAVIAVTNNKPLPVELTAFTAVAKNMDAQLAWNTAQEKNNDHFNVERSLNGTDFAKIGEVKGQGSKTTPTDYAFTDGGIGAKASGTVYYRLQQVDADGTATFSPVRTVQFGKVITPAISLYPNPTTTGTQLDLSLLPTGRYEVLVLDATGRKVLSTTLEAGMAHALDLSRVASGSYHVVVRGQNNGQLINLTKRLIKE